MTGRYFSSTELATYLGVSDRTVRELIRAGNLPAIQVGRLWRVHEQDAADFLAGMRAWEATPTFVYFVRSTTLGHIKIGMAKDVARRLRSLQATSADVLELMGSVSAGLFSEAELHRRFRTDRLHNEWFRASSDLVSFIGECVASPPPREMTA